MHVKMPCPRCGKGLRAAPEHLGRRARCPSCHETFVLQQPVAAEAHPVEASDTQSLRVVEPVPTESPAAQASQQALIAALEQNTAVLRSWPEQMQTMSSMLARQLMEGWEKILAQLQESHQSHIEQIRMLLADAARDKEELLARTKALHEGQLQQSAAITASLAQTAGDVNDQIRLVFQDQAKHANQIVAAVGSGLREIQDQLLASSQEQVKAEAQELRKLMTQSADALRQIAQDAAALPQKLSTALEVCGAELRRQLEQTGAKSTEALKKQTDTLVAIGDALESSAGDFAKQIHDVGAAHVQGLADAMASARESALETRKELAADGEKSAEQIERIATSIAAQAQVTSRQMAALQQAFNATASRSVEKLDAVRLAADESANERRQRLSAEAESLLTEVYRRSEQVLRQAWEMGTRSAAQQEAKLNALAERIIISLTQAQQGLLQPLNALGELVRGLEKLAPQERALARSIDGLTSADALRKTLSSIDQSLAHLNRVLQNMGAPVYGGASRP